MADVVSIIVVSFNTKEQTLECLTSIFEQASELKFEVIVYDNASSDGSADAIADHFPQVRLIRGKENLGFGRANNAASKLAVGEYLLLLNPDTIILNNAIKKLLDFALENPEASIWGGRTVFRDGTLNPTCVWRFPTIWSMFCQALGLHRLVPSMSLFNPEPYPEWHRDCARNVDIITGCFLLVTHTFWNRLGGFDEDFFMYSEEADLCYRARKMGGQALFTPSATIVHLDGATKQIPARKRSMLLAGRTEYMKKNWRTISAKLGTNILKFHVLMRLISSKIIAAQSRNPNKATNYELWKDVWDQRHSWSNGFDDWEAQTP